MKRPVIVCVEWEDPTTHSSWSELEKAEKEHASPIVSVGMLIKEDDKYLRIAMDWGKDGEVCTRGIIPKAAIRRRRDIKLPRGIWKELK
jgi:hypothetical protein